MLGAVQLVRIGFAIAVLAFVSAAHQSSQGAPLLERKALAVDDFFDSESRVAQMKRKSERYIPYSNWTDSRLIKLHKL
jgi:hypothetical protein